VIWLEVDVRKSSKHSIVTYHAHRTYGMIKRQTIDLAKDLIVDIRFSREKISKGMNAEEEQTYMEKCLAQLRILLSNRHNIKFDSYGWPTCLKGT